MRIAALMLAAAFPGQVSANPIFIECRSPSAPTVVFKLGTEPTSILFWQPSIGNWQTVCNDRRYNCSYQNGEWKVEYIYGRYKEYYNQTIISRNTGKAMNVSSGPSASTSFTNYYVCEPTADPAVNAKPAF